MSRLYDRNYLLCIASQTCFMIAWTLSAHYARWIGWLGGDQKTIGSVMGFGMIAGVLLRPWMGQWINRLGARVVWCVGYGVFITAALANLLLDDISWSIYAVRFALVVAASLTYGSSLTYITQNAPAERRTEAIGTFGLSGFSAMLIGPAIGDQILGTGARSRDEFELLFQCIALALVPAMALLFFLRPTPPEHRSRGVGIVDFVRAVRSSWPGTVVLVQIVFGACLTVPFIFLADFIDHRGLAEEGQTVGRFFLGYALCAMTIRIALRRVPERLGRRKFLLAGLLATVAGMGAFHLVISGDLRDMVIPGVCCGAGHGFVFHTMTSLTLERFPLEVRGSGSAFALMLLDAGTVVSSPILGWLAENYGYGALFTAVAGAVLVTVLIFTAASVPIWVERARARRAGTSAAGARARTEDRISGI